jgi:uncharacterized protein (TIGR03435 family)
LLAALPAIAQSPPFATITINPARSADPRNARVHVLPNGDLITGAVPVIRVLSYAYDVPVNPSHRLSPLPDWTLREKYDIEAKAPANIIPPSLLAASSLTCACDSTVECPGQNDTHQESELNAAIENGRQQSRSPQRLR